MKIFIITVFIYLFYISSLVSAGTLNDVKEREYLKCGIAEDLVGFATPNDDGEWVGFDVDFCRAIAAAIFADSSKVQFIITTTRSRFPSLAFGEIDMLVRNTTWTFSRDVNLEFEFVGINFYDGQAFMIPTSFDVKNINELDGVTLCVISGTSNHKNTINYFNDNNMGYDIIDLQTNDECLKKYLDGDCDVFTGDLSILASYRSKLPDPVSHLILPEIISKEPLSIVVRSDDTQWEDVVRWSLNAMIIAEERGIDQTNVDTMMDSSKGEILRILGAVGNYGNMLELENDWAYNIIKEVGNYGTVFDKNLGTNSVIGLDRGLNKLWKDGGLIYAPPFR